MTSEYSDGSTSRSGADRCASRASANNRDCRDKGDFTLAALTVWPASANAAERLRNLSRDPVEPVLWCPGLRFFASPVRVVRAGPAVQAVNDGRNVQVPLERLEFESPRSGAVHVRKNWLRSGIWSRTLKGAAAQPQGLHRQLLELGFDPQPLSRKEARGGMHAKIAMLPAPGLAARRVAFYGPAMRPRKRRVKLHD
jgi:hypothetical protein